MFQTLQQPRNCSQLSAEESEAQRGEAICLKSHSRQASERDSKPGLTSTMAPFHHTTSERSHRSGSLCWPCPGCQGSGADPSGWFLLSRWVGTVGWVDLDAHAFPGSPLASNLGVKSPGAVPTCPPPHSQATPPTSTPLDLSSL